MDRPRPRVPDVVAPLSPFVGRGAELEELARRFESGTRLVTLLGPPGMGKTRLALRACEEHLAAGGAAWFCDLTTATRKAELAAAVARVLDVRLSPGLDEAELVDDVAYVLSARGDALLVLDNFEQLGEGAADVVSRWCQLAPRARVLVTSRVRLSVDGESVFELPPLGLPATDDAGDGEAFALYVARAQAAGVAVGPEARADVAAIVRALDGIPLAIELAAARSRVLGPAALRTRLERQLDVLGAAKRIGGSRQETLRGAIEASWQALAPAEKDALAQLSVLAGGFTAEAADAVIAVNDPGAPPPLDLVAALRDRSLLTSELRDGEVRFSMYASIHELAREKARASGVDTAAAERHLAFFLELGERWAREHEQTGTHASRAKLSCERDNLTAAYRAIRDRPRAEADVARIVYALAPALEIESPHEELVRVLEDGIRAAAACGAAALEARLRISLGSALGIRGAVRGSLDEYEKALARARAVDDRAAEAWALSLSAVRFRLESRMEEAIAGGAAAIAALAGTSSPRVLATALVIMGLLHGEIGLPSEARAFNARARALFRELGDRFSEGLALANVAQVDQASGALAEAATGFDAAIEAFREVGDRRYEARYLAYRGCLELERGDLASAQATLDAAIDVLARLRMRHFEGLFRACRAVCLASSGRTRDAGAELDLADALLASLEVPAFTVAATVHRGHVERLAAVDARAGGDELRAERLEVSSRGRRAAAASHIEQSEDVRLAARLFDRAATGATPVTPRLVVGADGVWFSIDDGPRVDLGRRANLRRLLVALTERRREAPGAAVTAALLLERGWPGERVLAEAGSTRVRVAISTLRRMGLSRVLLTRDDGYLLDPTTAVDLEMTGV